MSILSNHAPEALALLNAVPGHLDEPRADDRRQQDRPAAWDSSPSGREINLMARAAMIGVLGADVGTYRLFSPHHLVGLAESALQLGHEGNARAYWLLAEDKLWGEPRLVTPVCHGVCTCQDFRNGD
jgi:hypothetical protein